MDNLSLSHNEVRNLTEKFKNIGIIIQCRDKSTRMKHKSVRPFHKGKSILQILLEKFEHLPEKVVVATTNNSPLTINICRNLGVSFKCGSEENVADRLFQTAKIYNLRGFFRVCADNPLIALGLQFPLTMWGWDYDYIAYKDCMKRHEGFWMEYIKTDALYKSMMGCIGMYDLEHVTPFIIRNPWLFKQKILPIPKQLNELDIRLTVDTMSDFKIAQKVYANVGDRYWGWVLEYLEKHPNLYKKMKKNKEENTK